MQEVVFSINVVQLTKGDVMSKVLSVLLAASLMLTAEATFADDWNLVKNVKRLGRVAQDHQEDKSIDKKFLDVLDLTEKTRKEGEVYDEARKIAKMPTLNQSRYMDAFLYYMLAKSAVDSKPQAETDYWLGQLKTYEKSPHLLAAWLIHLKQLPKDSPEVRRDTQLLVDWIKAQKPEMKVRAPEYSGNALFGFKPRADFAGGDYPKVYSLAHYKMAVKAPDGFHDDDTYVSLLAQIKDGHEDILSEMAEIYRKNGKREEASDALYQIAQLKVNAKDFQHAKTLLDDAVRLNGKNEDAKKERDRIKLELTYQSLQPQEKAEAPAAAPAEAPAAAPAPQ
jgi:hypothetical protein